MGAWPRTPPPSGFRVRDLPDRHPDHGNEQREAATGLPRPSNEVEEEPWWVEDFIAIELFLRKGHAASR